MNHRRHQIRSSADTKNSSINAGHSFGFRHRLDFAIVWPPDSTSRNSPEIEAGVPANAKNRQVFQALKYRKTTASFPKSQVQLFFQTESMEEATTNHGGLYEENCATILRYP